MIFFETFSQHFRHYNMELNEFKTRILPLKDKLDRFALEKLQGRERFQLIEQFIKQLPLKWQMLIQLPFHRLVRLSPNACATSPLCGRAWSDAWGVMNE